MVAARFRLLRVGHWKRVLLVPLTLAVALVQAPRLGRLLAAVMARLCARVAVARAPVALHAQARH